MDRNSFLDALRVLQTQLGFAVNYSRMLPNHCDQARLFRRDIGRHWQDECEEHLRWHEEYLAAARKIGDSGYPIPESWWLAEFEPQICYVECDADDRAWILGTWPRLVEGSTPEGVVAPAGTPVFTDLEGAQEIDGIMNESVVRAWEEVRRDIAETERRIVEGSLAESSGRTNSPDDSALPRANLKTNQVRYGDQCYDVTADGALLFSKLIESHPHAFSASSLFSKPSRVKQGLPKPLQELIVTETGKGYRLNLA